jgi:uridine kinase
MSGAGKTTFARELSAKLGDCPIIHIDDYYDCAAGRLKSEEVESDFRERSTVDCRSPIIVEGVYSLKFDFGYNLRIFMEVGEQEQLRRIGERSPDLLEEYRERWIPRENQYFKEYKIKEKCNYVKSI